MRKTFLAGAVAWTLFALASSADPPTRQRLIRYFGEWYSYLPGSRISVTETPKMNLPGLEAYRVQRHSSSKLHQESNVALLDRVRDELFVGEVFFDEARHEAGRGFEPEADLPNIEASLREAYGLPVRMRLRGASRGPLQAVEISIRQDADAFVSLPGFVSEDGAFLLLGEFLSLSEGAAAYRKRLLAESKGVRPTSGRFYVTEFLDFQCERCRVRAPAVKKAVEERGGAIEVRFLPLAKAHDWAFAAVESAAALSNLSAALYRKYEETLFARDEGMNEKAARELASDIAEAAGSKKEFEEELASGRARERVLYDIRLAMRLGITGTPYFLYEGVLFSGERDLLETYLREKLPAREPKPAAAAR